MTLEQLKKQNPGLYAECMAAGIEEGVRHERARCLSLLPTYTGDPMADYALNCIRNGEPLGDKQKAQYTLIQIKSFQREKRAAQEADFVVSQVEAKIGVNRDGYDND